MVRLPMTMIAEPCAAGEVFRYNGNSTSPDYYPGTGRRRAPPISERKVIAWDMEGMSLSGMKAPQHPVLFGCSADPDNMLVAKRLTTFDMLSYIIDIGARFPHAIHVGFGFRYDVNMILQGLPVKLIIRLWRTGYAHFHTGGFFWVLSWRPGKTFTVTKRWGVSKTAPSTKTTVTIHDYSSFFGGQAFLPVAEEILRDTMTDEDRETIARGKAARGQQGWNELPEVAHYWGREIQLIRRTFEVFRDVMVRAGFPLNDWYGPGALANFINSSRGIRPHLGAAQVTTGFMPDEVHAASKIAFSGGRFELFNAGRHVGPVHSIDINSAYPFALTMVPSLHPDEGEWRHVESPDRIKRFGFYRVTFRAAESRPFEKRPMPLFWRDTRGLISYPNRVTGWYASPEARMVLGMPGVTVHEGWYWDSREEVFPWEFLHEMYATRQRLGKGNLLSLPFKLGPNSLYGKYAQTVGWNTEERLPPRSHALPVAAWVTSMCRSLLWDIIRQNPGSIIGVETDSVFTTTDPASLRVEIGSELGHWSLTTYDEVLYLQSGMYHTKRGGEWTGTRSRGLRRAEYTPDMAREYLQSLQPGKYWEPLTLTTSPRFIGAGLAAASSARFRDIHCSWRPQTREVTLGEAGKRRHVSLACDACREGSTPWDAPHRLVVASRSDAEHMSQPRRLPWESEHTDEVREIRDMRVLERELISR